MLLVILPIKSKGLQPLSIFPLQIAHLEWQSYNSSAWPLCVRVDSQAYRHTAFEHFSSIWCIQVVDLRWYREAAIFTDTVSSLCHKHANGNYRNVINEWPQRLIQHLEFVLATWAVSFSSAPLVCWTSLLVMRVAPQRQVMVLRIDPHCLLNVCLLFAPHLPSWTLFKTSKFC
jgi:hypothetical protein